MIVTAFIYLHVEVEVVYHIRYLLVCLIQCILNQCSNHVCNRSTLTHLHFKTVWINALARRSEGQLIELAFLQIDRRSHQPLVHRVLERVSALYHIPTIAEHPCVTVFIAIDNGEVIQCLLGVEGLEIRHETVCAKLDAVRNSLRTYQVAHIRGYGITVLCQCLGTELFCKLANAQVVGNFLAVGISYHLISHCRSIKITAIESCGRSSPCQFHHSVVSVCNFQFKVAYCRWRILTYKHIHYCRRTVAFCIGCGYANLCSTTRQCHFHINVCTGSRCTCGYALAVGFHFVSQFARKSIAGKCCCRSSKLDVTCATAVLEVCYY